ncbi:site-specific recombinase XerD [Thioalkalivibrio sp. ALE21]|uniref:tyrosine-type recombinase/integrase n=1 Tax=Thioalkalivibrio sp. ALE21 TaxID=1158175 RepID=UPI000D8F647D|nr:site-specific integrase [Thioalkalivibrio sp. ALE21]PYG00745.1 site-specific recombinase XerD [Thioalkalivibrio sp. ALE21]
MWTDAKIKGLPVPEKSPKRYFEGSADPQLKGFGIRVMPKTGARRFFVAFTSPTTGKRRTMPLGEYPGVSLADARQRCREARDAVNAGRDPLEDLEAERERTRAEQREAEQRGDMDALGALYVHHLEMQGKHRGADEVRSIWARDVSPVVGKKPARDVTPDDVADILARVLERARARGRTGETMANRVRSYLRAAFKVGRRAARDPALRSFAPRFDLETNPVGEIEKATKRELPRNRNLSPDEVRAVWFGLSEPYTRTRTFVRRGREVTQTQTFAAEPVVSDAVRWMLATGQRVEEVLGMRWDEIDRSERLWVMPAERRKNRAHNLSREPHLVPLTDWHLELLDEIAEHRVDDSPWLFASPRNPQQALPPNTLSQGIRRFCDRTGLERFQPRDLRRTWKTLAGRAGIDLEIRNRIQGHAMADVGSRHYDRYDYLTEKRAAMERWAAWLQRSLAGEAPGAVVVSMGAA